MYHSTHRSYSQGDWLLELIPEVKKGKLIIIFKKKKYDSTFERPKFERASSLTEQYQTTYETTDLNKVEILFQVKFFFTKNSMIYLSVCILLASYYKACSCKTSSLHNNLAIFSVSSINTSFTQLLHYYVLPSTCLSSSTVI